jgi:gliding motility-associated-like protein
VGLAGGEDNLPVRPVVHRAGNQLVVMMVIPCVGGSLPTLKTNLMLRYALIACAFLPAGLVNAQLAINNTLTPAQLVQNVLLGGGVTASNISYNGVPSPATAQVGTGTFTATNSNLGLTAGVILATGSVNNAAGLASQFSGDANGTGSDPDLALISGQNINDRAVLEFDFIPTGDTLRFRYVFASEEYPEFVCSINDAFGFFLSGPGITGPFSNNAINIALVPGNPPTIPVTINTVNNGVNNNPNDPFCPAQNAAYYVDNGTGTTVVYDGFTVVLTAFALVTCGATYHIKIAIGDASDSTYDSAVFLEAGSFASSGNVVPDLASGTGINGNTMMEGCGPFEMVFTRLGDLSEDATVDLTIAGTATPGVDYSPAFPSQLFFPANVEQVSIWLDVPADADGPETLIINIVQLVICSGQQIQTTFTFNIDSPPPLNVNSYDINGVCGQTHLLNPQVSGGVGEYQFSWSTGATSPTISVSPGVTTIFGLTVSDGCEVQSETVEYVVTLPVYPPLQLTADPDLAIDCLGNDNIGVSSVSGGNSNFSYQWTLGGAPVGTTATINVPAANPAVYYVLTVTDGCGSSIQDSVLVSTVPLPPIEISTTGDVTVICPGDATLMQITGVVGGNGVYTYQWTNQAGQTLSTTTSLEVAVNADRTYTITVRDQCQNVGDTTITTFLPEYAQFLLSLPSDRVICAGDSLDLLALVTGGSGYYFLDWHELDHSDPILHVQPWEHTLYRVTATDQCGEQRTDEVLIQVEHVTVGIVETNRGQDDWYLQAATTPYALTWMWDMGDGTRYRGPEVVHSYMDLEEHWVTLYITTPNGCTGMDSLLLRSPAHIYFPNAFTPDGDGYNDFFGAIGHYISEFEMEIFDRWGRPVFRSQSIDTMWDGSVNGSGKAMTGVYVYKYRAVGHYFPAVEGYGHVTLIQGSNDN